MRIYVACDLEGVAGVIDHAQQCCWDTAKGWYSPYLAQARRLATLELNALVEGALEGGATEVVAWDGHGSFPDGLDIELLHPECKLVMGAGDGGPAGLDEHFAGLFQLGLHAMAGTPRAVMAHSFDGSLVAYWVNDMRVGEIWMNCYTAGLSGVPFVFLSGDKAAAADARALVPGVEIAIAGVEQSFALRGGPACSWVIVPRHERAPACHQIPPWLAGRVARLRLLEQLWQGLMENRKLTLISAPAGYGKTTLVAEWIAALQSKTENRKPRVAWLSRRIW